jgi:hypothetical protein
MRAILAAIMILATAAGLATAAAPAALAATKAPKPVAYDCHGWHGGQVRAAQLELSCEGTVVVTVSAWRYWSGISARTKTATLLVNTCRPDCAAGHYRKYAATVILYRARSHGAVRYYTRLKLTYWHNGLRHYIYRWARYPGATQPVWVGGP